MLKEYLARVDLENSEELDKLQIQMKGLLDELNVKQELIDKLRREKNLDINIFSPRSMDAEADEKIEKAMQEKLEINQRIEYVRGLIETYTKKKMEYEELRKELMESEIDAKTDSGEEDGKVKDEETEYTEVVEKTVKEKEIEIEIEKETEDAGTDNQKIEDGNNDNVGTGITDINKPEINTEILPDGKSVTLSNKNNLQNVRDKVSSAIDKNMRFAAEQTEHSEQSDNEMTDCEASEHDKMSEHNKMPGHDGIYEHNKMPGHDEIYEYNKMPGHDKVSEHNGTPELNKISQYDEPEKSPVNRKELLDFLDAIYRQTELCMAITSNRNQCKAELRSLKSKIKNYAAKIEVQD